MSVRSPVLVTLVFLLGSCATYQKPDPFDSFQGDGWNQIPPRDLLLRVENKHFDPVMISAVWEGMNYFLGEVSPGATEVYPVPGHLLVSEGCPRFLARPRGSAQEQLTEPLECEGARWVEWHLKRHLHPSRLLVLGP